MSIPGVRRTEIRETRRIGCPYQAETSGLDNERKTISEYILFTPPLHRMSFDMVLNLCR